NLNGSSPNDNFITGATGPQGLTIDSNFIYWSNNSGTTIGRAKLDGTGINQNYLTGANAPAYLAVDSGHVYWANSGGGTMGRFSFGTAINSLTTIASLSGSNGSALYKNVIDSTTAFQIQNASAGSVFDIDTSNGRVGIGTATPGQKLDVNGNIRVASSNFISWGASDAIKIQDAGSNTLNVYTSGTLQTSLDASGNFILSGNGLLVMGTKASDPTCTNGATYYNSTTNTFRGCANGTWNDFSLGGAIPAGTISPYAGSTAPAGYFIADGSPVSRTTYSALFAVIGTTYGTGDGSTTFNLPDLRGRVAVGLGTNADVSSLGANDGSVLASRTPRHNSTYNTPSISRSADVILNDPGHSHSIYNFFGGGVTQNGALCGCNNGGGTTSTNSSFTGITVSQQPNFSLSGGSVGPGGSRPTDTPAYVTLNYIIKY
ncbi:MAG TPA: tail fiber protein, partial [Candidatus Saccharimonadales bacterium]|nr:tail fiber protein [Candidatus Saccharimonadales bacterium]